jgi:hypothetical protein
MPGIRRFAFVAPKAVLEFKALLRRQLKFLRDFLEVARKREVGEENLRSIQLQRGNVAISLL